MVLQKSPFSSESVSPECPTLNSGERRGMEKWETNTGQSGPLPSDYTAAGPLSPPSTSVTRGNGLGLCTRSIDKFTRKRGRSSLQTLPGR